MIKCVWEPGERSGTDFFFTFAILIRWPLLLRCISPATGFFPFRFLVKMKYIGGGSFICPHLSQVEREPSDFWRRFQNDVGRYQTVRKTIFCGASLLPIFKFLLKNSELNKNVCIIIRRWWNVCVRVLKFKKIKKEREEGGNSYPGADRRPSWPVRKSSSSHKSLSLSLFSFLKNF
jgi:hypothetical protein